MIYNLFLNAYTNAPLTNYYSAVSATEYAQRVFAIDWSFLPQDKNLMFHLNLLQGRHH